MSDKPLWMPKGSVRAILTLLIVGTGVFLYATGGNVPDALSGLLGAVFVFYFKERGA